MINSPHIQGADSNELRIDKCLFKWLINSYKGSAITVEKDSLTFNIKNSYFLGCISRYYIESSPYSGTIYLISGLSTLKASNLIFISAYGYSGSCIQYQGKNPNSGDINIQRTITSGCWGRWAVIDIFYSHVYARDYNSSFCDISELHNFCIEFSLEEDASFFIHYKNSGSIQFCTCCSADNNNFTNSVFIENTHKKEGYGLVHSNNPTQVTFVNKIVFMENTETLFHSVDGKFIISNIICDSWSYNGYNYNIETTSLIIGTLISFPSPVNNIEIMNFITFDNNKKNSVLITTKIGLFTIILTDSKYE